jgi:hypothetical protein
MFEQKNKAAQAPLFKMPHQLRPVPEIKAAGIIQGQEPVHPGLYMRATTLALSKTQRP